MPNYKEPFKDRMKCNRAEIEFEKWCELNNIKFYKYGIDNHPFGSDFFKVEKKIRSTPDYIAKNDRFCFVEVKGCKNNIKIKEKDIEAYKFWNNLMPLNYCFYSIIKNELKIISHSRLMELIPMCETGNYPDATIHDDKLYYKIIWSMI